VWPIGSVARWLTSQACGICLVRYGCATYHKYKQVICCMSL